MSWNRFCFFALMCFSSPRKEMNSDGGMCSYYQSEDVDRKSLVIDVSKQRAEWRIPSGCIGSNKFHTILMYTPSETISLQLIKFHLTTINYHHLIVLNEPLPQSFCPQAGNKKMEAVSLTVQNNANMLAWDWLKCVRFMYIRIENCHIRQEGSNRIDTLIFTGQLLTLTLVKIEYLSPFDLKYWLAPNLRELTVNHFNISSLSRATFSDAFPELRKLNLGKNGIENVDKNFFNFMGKLVALNVEGNHLTAFNPTFDSPPRRIFLDGNPLEGDYKTCKLLQSTKFAYFSGEDIICENWRGNSSLGVKRISR